MNIGKMIERIILTSSIYQLQDCFFFLTILMGENDGKLVVKDFGKVTYCNVIYHRHLGGDQATPLC